MGALADVRSIPRRHVAVAYLGGTVHRSKGVRVDSLAHCKLVRHLEEGSHAEDLGQVSADASEHVVVEEDIALNFLCQRLYRARVGQAELCTALRERVYGISDGERDWVGKENGA